MTTGYRNTCQVHWAELDAARPGDEQLLTADERARAERFRQDADRARFVLATALLRRVVAEAVGCPPAAVEVDRRCRRCGEPHGRPLLPGLDMHASITHSGDVVGVAIAGAGPVGLDVEVHGRHDVARMAAQVLGPDERVSDDADFYRYWSRKEAVVKATGDGIGVGLARVLVSPPDRPPRLLAYPGRPGLRAQLVDLDPAADHAATVAVLTSGPLLVVERRHRRDDGEQDVTVQAHEM